MAVREVLPLDIDQLGAYSKKFLQVILQDFPHFEPYARMEMVGEKDGFSLNMMVPSPTQDKNRDFGFFVVDENGPSIGFGPTHTHGYGDEDNAITQIIDLAKAIVKDELAIIEGVDGKQYAMWLDLSEKDAVAEYLTSRRSLDTIVLKTWSGKGDRIVSLSDLKL